MGCGRALSLWRLRAVPTLRWSRTAQGIKILGQPGGIRNGERTFIKMPSIPSGFDCPSQDPAGDPFLERSQQGICYLKQGRMKSERHTLRRCFSQVPSLPFDAPSRKMADSLSKRTVLQSSLPCSSYSQVGNFFRKGGSSDGANDTGCARRDRQQGRGRRRPPDSRGDTCLVCLAGGSLDVCLSREHGHLHGSQRAQAAWW